MKLEVFRKERLDFVAALRVIIGRKGTRSS